MPKRKLVSDGSSVRGRIVEFNRHTCVGVALYDLTPVRFHSTTFQGRGWPRVGQHVEIIFNHRGELVSLHEL